MTIRWKTCAWLMCVLAVGFTLALQGCKRDRPPEHPSIVLITIDTLRSDHLSTYGYFRETSPTLDSFSREAAVFENALTTMATTLPAHVSLMTSTRTTTHGLKGNFEHFGGVLDEQDGLRTMAEILSEVGYRTAAFVSATPVGGHTGLQRGFEAFDQPESRERRADETIDRALDWLDTTHSRPYFLWIHLFDPHRPRDPPAPYDDAFKTDDSLLEFLQARSVARAQDPFVQRQNNAYDGEILFTDSQIGRVFVALKAQNVWEGTAVVVTADHGEGLGQHDWMWHGRIYNEQLRVPLLMKLPPGKGPQGVRIPRIASLIDVLPTLVGALDLPVTERDRTKFEGIDLLAADDTRPGVVSEQVPRKRMEAGTRISLTSRDWKYFLRSEAQDELYDLARDPFETEDVLEHHPEIASRMRHQLLGILAESKRDNQDRPDAHLDDEVIEQLRALGYMGGPSAGSETNTWRGMLVWGHEVRELLPCGSGTALWVADETGELWEIYREITLDAEPYTKVYVELVGEVGPPPREGVGVNHDGSIRVIGVLNADSSGGDCGDG